ncbi:hypothetical protein D3C72_769940 [compost metagenome]
MDRIGRLLVGLTMLVGTGCVYHAPVAGWDGALAVQARFPEGRRVQVIPVGTRRIEVRVTGAGIPTDSVFAATLTPDRSQVTFSGVPSGAKTIAAKAYGDDDTILAAGGTDVQIVPGATVLARIRLTLLTDEGQFELVLE